MAVCAGVRDVTVCRMVRRVTGWLGWLCVDLAVFVGVAVTTFVVGSVVTGAPL
jgi:hypothetical protein